MLYPTGQIIAFGIGSFLIGAGVVTIIAGLITLELRGELERLKERLDIERKTANSWFSRYHALKAQQQPRDPATGKMLPKYRKAA